MFDKIENNLFGVKYFCLISLYFEQMKIRNKTSSPNDFKIMIFDSITLLDLVICKISFNVLGTKP